MFGAAISWLTAPENQAPILTAFFIVQKVAMIVASIAAPVAVFVKNDKRLVIAIIASVAFLSVPYNVISDLLWSIQTGASFNFFNSLFDLGWQSTWWWIFEILGFFLALVGLVLYLVSFKVKFAPKPATAPAANRFDPMTGEPIQQPVAATPGTIAQDGLPVSNLPQLAFILGILTPLIGVILGAVSLNQMKLGQISRVNEKQARNGILIGSILMGVGFVFSIILIVVSVILAAKAYNPYSY